MTDAIKDLAGSAYRVNLGNRDRRELARVALVALLTRPDATAPFWGYQRFKLPSNPEVDLPIKNPTRGGASHQIDAIPGHVLAWLLFDDEAALVAARIRGPDLLERIAEADNGHQQLWGGAAWSAALMATAYERHRVAKLVLAASQVRARSRILVDPANELDAGIRPQVRALAGAYEWAFWLERLRDMDLLTPGDLRGIVGPDALRALADAGLDIWFGADRVGTGTGSRGFIGEPGKWSASGFDPVSEWAYSPGGTSGGIGSHVVAFHVVNLWHTEAMRIEAYRPGGLKPLWRARTRDVADWAWALAVDEATVQTMKAGKNTFEPDVFAGLRTVSPSDPRTARGPFSAWPETIRKDRGENQYTMAPILYFRSGPAAERLAQLREWSVRNKETWTPGHVPQTLFWVAAELERRKRA